MKYLVHKSEDTYIVKYKTDSTALPRGEGYLFAEGVDTDYPIITEDEEGNLVVVENETPKLIKAAYDSMVAHIYAEMLTVFGTSNDASAAAFAATYEAMKARPESYVGKLGLTTKEEVEAYATAKLLASDNYAIYRMEKISEYQITKAGLE